MFMERNSVVALFIIAFLVIPTTAVQAEKSTSQSDEALHITGWRLPSKIVLRGNVAGLDRLREIANGIELQSDSKMPTEGEPTLLVGAVVSTLSELQSGWVDIGDRKLSIVGVAESISIERLKKNILQHTSKNMKIVTLQIDSLDRPPFQWAAFRYKDEFGSDTIELNGLAIDENARAKLISMARGASGDVIVVDKMKVQSSHSLQLTDAAAAGLAQLGQLDDGFVWVNANEIELFGSSFDHSVSDRKLGCAILSKVIPKGIGCGIVDIVQRQRHSRYQHSSRGGHANNDTIAKNHFSKTKPFVAVDPNKLKASSPIDECYDPRVVDIFFATSRKLEQADTPAAPTFSGERGTLSYGLARIRIPEDHKIGRLELPGGFSIFGIQLTEETDPKKHFILRSRQPLTLEQWDSKIEGMGPTEAVIFVHGFNTSFDDSAIRFAQIVWDLQYKGLPVLFSWPSRGAVIDYAYDRDSALGARDAFLDLLSNLRDKHKISTVHVIAHSMGNFLVLDALTRLAKSPTQSMGQLIMAAPDVDRDQFVQEIPKIRQFFRGLTLYASSADKALAMSMRVAGRIPRAGNVPAEGPIVLPGLETLDVTALGEEMFGLNHTTFAQARPLIDDISLILSEGRHAPRLAQERPMPENASAPKYWRFAP